MNLQKIKEKIKQHPKTSVIIFVLTLTVLALISFTIVVFFGKSSFKEVKDKDISPGYFHDSVLKRIKDYKLSFSADLKVFKINDENDKPKEELMNAIKSKYEFKSKTEQVNLKYFENGKNVWTHDVLTIDDMDESYRFDLKTCNSSDKYAKLAVRKLYLKEWMTEEVIDNEEILMISPNYLLYYILLEEKPFDVFCTLVKDTDENGPVKCKLTKYGTTIEYYFENHDKETMYPKEIKVFKRQPSSIEWIYYRKIEYDSFKIASELEIINKNLPIGLGCQRQDMTKYELLNYFSLNEFEFDYNLNLTYIDEKTKKKMSKMQSNSKIYSLVSNINPAVPYKLKMYVSNGIDEETTKPMKTFYDKYTKIFYDYYPEENGQSGKCFFNNYENAENNWFYFQDLFVKDLDNFLYWRYYYSYLGAYKVDGSDSLVFEKKLYFFAKNENELVDENFHSKNLNSIISEYAIATYYFDAKESRFHKTRRLTIPFKMEFRLKGKDEVKDVGQLTIDINKFSHSIEKSEKLYSPFQNCVDIKGSKGYDMISIKYFKHSEPGAKKLTNERIKQKFKKSIGKFISPLRSNQIDVKIIKEDKESKESVLHIEFRLYDTLYPENEFEITEGEDFESINVDDTNILKEIDEKDCLKSCLEKDECAAFSHNRLTSDCKLLKIEDYNYLLYKDKKIDFYKYFNTIGNADSKLGVRVSFYFYPKHGSNEQIIELMKKEIKKGYGLTLLFNEDDKAAHSLKAKELRSNRIDATTAFES